MPGASIRATSSPSERTTASVPATSPRRASAPGRASTARSPQTTTVSSRNAESGSSSAGGASGIAQPRAPAGRLIGVVLARRGPGVDLQAVDEGDDPVPYAGGSGA